MSSIYHGWEPRSINESEFTARCISRIQRDISDIMSDPPEGIFVLPDEENMCLVKVLITGPSGTPYCGGMFSFLVGFTPDYPIKPPKVKCLTTGGNTVSFNPNIYSNGKVCLSILGTWNGPAWSPALNLESVLVSIQSLLNEEPYRNEPGYEKASADEVRDYNYVIQHETIRIAVIDVMENIDTYHEYFAEKISVIFYQNYDRYIRVCRANMHLDEIPEENQYVRYHRQFQFKSLLEKLDSYM